MLKVGGGMTQNIKVFEIRLKVFLLQDIQLNSVQKRIADFIDSALVQDEKFKKYHEENFFKLYSFNMFYPIEKDGIYKREQIYTVIIRTVEPELAHYLSRELNNHNTPYIKGLTTDNRIVPRKMIEELYTLTPVIIKRNGEGYWREGMSVADYERRIFENAVKKYNQYTGEKMDEEFQLYTSISFLNKKPVAVACKSVKLLGDKINLKIADNQQAQELAYFLTGVGTGENNSRGSGFVNYRWL